MFAGPDDDDDDDDDDDEYVGYEEWKRADIMKIWGTGDTAGSGLTMAFAWRSYTVPTSIVTLRTGRRNGGGSTRTGVGMSY